MKVYTVEVKKQRGWVVVCSTYDIETARSVAEVWTRDGYQAIVTEKRG